jgi:hypothetical protein
MRSSLLLVVFSWPLITPALIAMAADTAGSTVRVWAFAWEIHPQRKMANDVFKILFFMVAVFD